ncbi:MAG TPA: CheR family methyltransferase [Bryobacteraceae bacterium]|jgi:chemotaxis protein methyltransferase CheR
MSAVSGATADELLRDPWYPHLKDYLIRSTGLAYYSARDADLADRVRRRLSGLGVRDCASYLERLRNPGEGPAEMDALIAEIAIGETYFFRHREHFDALRDVVLPGLMARKGAERKLRIWCAGCADGAEPYSLAILLRREFGHLLADWDVSILGTDISRQFLASARAGEFEEWSFRATPDDIRRACFRKNGKRWTIAPEYRVGVSFQFHNLAENAFPPLSDLAAFDLIVCRNVMIYFGPELMRTVVSQFHACLKPGAWLLVGPAEPNMAHFTLFKVVNAPGVTLYQRRAFSTIARDETQQEDTVRRFVEPDAAPIAEAGVRVAAERLIAAPAAPPGLADLRRYADQGDWANAVRCGKELLASDNLNAQVHFHYALVLEQAGDYADAEESLRKAIYLNRQWPLAHYHLGLLLQSRGETRRAARCFDNVLGVLASLAEDVALPDADRITVAEMRKLARMQLQVFEAGAVREEL